MDGPAVLLQSIYIYLPEHGAQVRGFRYYHSGFQTQGYHIGVAKLP